MHADHKYYNMHIVINYKWPIMFLKNIICKMCLGCEEADHVSVVGFRAAQYVQNPRALSPPEDIPTSISKLLHILDRF